MSKNLSWRGAIVAFLIFMAFLYLTPSLRGELPAWWSNFLPQEKIHLGLDLQGGMHLVLEVDTQKAVESTAERVSQEIREQLKNNRLRNMPFEATLFFCQILSYRLDHQHHLSRLDRWNRLWQQRYT